MQVLKSWKVVNLSGRPGKPVDLLLLNGTKHLTKEEIEARTAQENSLKSKAKYKPNKKVIQNKTAYTMFKKLKTLYKDIEYVDGLDENIINRYCLMTAEIDSLENLASKMEDDLENCEEFTDRLQLYKAISGTEITINRIRDMLLKIEDRLFLNPTSRVKNVPHKEKEKPEESKWSKYGNGQGNGVRPAGG
jgi:phage terminase small subunit